MSIDIYFLAASPPCRAVQMAAAAVDVQLNIKPLNPMLGEQFNPDFVKINPQHTIPTIKDGDFVLWESRAIMGYLVNKYGKDDRYYPKDPVQRAIVDQRLHFDLGVLYHRFADYHFPQILKLAPADPEKYEKMVEGMDMLNVFLDGQRYAAGDQITIADFTLLATVSCYVEGGPKFCLKDHPNIQRWYNDCKMNVPGYEATVEGLEKFKSVFEGPRPLKNPNKEVD